MGLQVFLGFAPFLAFALIETFFGLTAGLAGGFFASLILLAREFFVTSDAHRLNVLEAGSALIFGALTAIAFGSQVQWTVWEVRLCVDLGLSLVVLASIALGRPFTLQHARRRVSPEAARSHAFLRTNNVIAAAWAIAFAALAAIDLYMWMTPQAPTRRGILLTVAALALAAKFTQSRIKRALNDARHGESH